MAERITIARLGADGAGLAETKDGVVRVPFALPGETVLVEPSDRPGEPARLLGVETASPDRVQPFCPHFGTCGGCRFQLLDENVYAEWKRDRVVAGLRRHGVEATVDPMLDAHGSGRRRMVLHVRETEGGVRAGFMAAGTHRLVPIARCPIAVPALADAPRIAETLASQAMMGGKVLDVAVTQTSTGLDVDLRGSGRPSEKRVQALIALAADLDLARLSVHGEVLVERRPPALSVGPASVVAPPGSFLQATARGEDALGAAVLDASAGARRAADLFSGIGPIALRLAAKAEVHAVESHAPMLEALDRAARRTPGLRRVTTEVRDLFRRPLLPNELDRFDLVVLDPPRQGAEAQVRQIVLSSLDRVVMVSCDAGTFARDAASLAAGGFSLAPVRVIDQFKWSAHVELVGVFRRPPRRRSRR